MTELDTLIRKRGTEKSKLTNFSKYFDPLHVRFVANEQLQTKEIIELKTRVEKLKRLIDDFESIQQEIELACDETQLDVHYNERNLFTNYHYDYLAKADEILEKYKENNYSIQSNTTTSLVSNNVNVNTIPSINNSAVKLPAIKCPTFNCEFNKWLEFKDTFQALFHDNPSLTDIQKYHYLRSCLGEEALKIIQSLEFAAHNYNDAWGLLCDRFDNNRLLVNNHLKSLFEIDCLTRESSLGLRGLIDSVNKHLRALKTLKLPTDQWDAIIIYMISSKLDKSTNREWEQARNDKSLPTLNIFFEFLKNRADFLETLEMNNFQKYKDSTSIQPSRQKSRSLFVGDSSNSKVELKCNFCKQNHLIYSCQKFLSLPVQDRWEKVRQLRLCSNCLCFGHFSKNCKAGSCKLCGSKHSSLLHNKKSQDERVNQNEVQDLNGSSTSQQLLNQQTVAGTNSSIVCTTKISSGEKYVFLSTAIVNVQDRCGQLHKAHAILDSGSQCSLITDAFRKRLGLKGKSAELFVSGINNSSSNVATKCEILLKSTINNFESKLNCFVIPKITDNFPSQKIDISKWIIPSQIKLANPQFNLSRSVDILIGADLFWDVISEEKIKLGKNQPFLINTVFGYVVSGSVNIPMQKTISCNFIVNDDLQKFWELEEIPSDSVPLTKEELFCEEHFNETVSRDIAGKFVVRFPLRENPSVLGDSRELAIKRLLFQEKKLDSNNVLKTKYFSFMNEYLELGHMRKLSKNECNNIFRCFLPHFAVIREESLTTAVRIVFDASVKTKSGISLNDIQYSGPPIQNDIFGIMLRFREHRFVVIADICKMYRQILIHPDERYLQNVFWRSDSNEDILGFELQTVTYGTASAPYLAIKCVKRLALENKDSFPAASELIDRDMYVDDLITGFDNEDEAIVVCNDISNILKSASFSLRKWASNSEKILKGIHNTSDAFSVLELGENDGIKTLGVQWLSRTDLLSFKVQNSSNIFPITKRNLLSSIAKIYDPLGLVSPCIVVIKILIQKLWSLKLDWDELVPSELSEKWKLFHSQLTVLNELKIPRFVMCNNSISVELHGFSDASMNAYSAVVYVRTIDPFGNVCVKLLCSKTRVAPVKVITIPRLELCGALALARLMQHVSNSLTSSFKTFFWCDSQIVLSWLHSDADKLQVFVGNRVTEIQRLCDTSLWSYVNTKDNPADVASRGILPEALLKCDMWWNGPSFLYKGADWPREFRNLANNELPETRKTCSMIVTNHISIIKFERFSKLNRLVNTFAYCLRFIKSLKTKIKTTGALTVSELEESMQNLIKMSQHDSFANELALIRAGKDLSNKHRLLCLNPFIDSDDILRVGGRLKHSSLSFNEKHPILLDGKHKLSRLIFQAEHIKLHHAGPQLGLFSVRQKYWVTSGMNISKLTIRNCVSCFRCKPKPANSIMADLPKSRVEVARPFAITGLDYAGPVILRDRKGRPYKTYKAYICLFICFVTKCLHIELVTDLTSEAFISTFRRFAARRGTPSQLYSDNGSNFVGAKKELKELYTFLENSQDEFVRVCALEKISWHFIPPNSPNFGGLWESNIKATKYHLHRVIGNSILTYEEYCTLLGQVEAILNSRPLYQMSSDPNDFTPLTPSHFLIGQPLVTPPDPLFGDDCKISRLSRFQLIQQLNQSFWKRWSESYLSELQKRNKWKTGNPNIEIGRMVVVKNDNLPPCRWVLGRIVAVYPGSDNKVRVVSVKTAQGIYKRAISKICPLPLQENN